MKSGKLGSYYMERLLKNVSWIFTGNVVSALVKWLILILIARIFTPKELGIYSLAFAITSPIALFMNMKLRALAVTDPNLNFKSYIISRNLLTLFSIILLIGISIVIYPDYTLIIVLVGLSKIMDLHSEIYYSLPQINNDFNYIGKLMIYKHLFILTSFIIAIALTKNLMLSLLIQFISQFTFFHIIEKKGINKKYSSDDNSYTKEDVKRIIKYGLPLGLSLMLISLTSNFPKYLLEYFISTEMVGFYSAITYIVIMGNLVMNSISQNFLPKLTELFNESEFNIFKKYVFLYLTCFSILLGVIIILFSILLGDIFLEIVYGPSFTKYSNILIIMSIAVTLNFISWNFDTAIMSMRYISIQPKISIIVLIVSILSGYILIPLYEINGAAYAMIVTFMSQLLIRLYFVIKKLNTQEVRSS